MATEETEIAQKVMTCPRVFLLGDEYLTGYDLPETAFLPLPACYERQPLSKLLPCFRLRYSSNRHYLIYTNQRNRKALSFTRSYI